MFTCVKCAIHIKVTFNSLNSKIEFISIFELYLTLIYLLYYTNCFLFRRKNVEVRTILLNDAPDVISEARSPPRLICRLSDYEKFCFRDISARAYSRRRYAINVYLRFVSPRKKGISQ